MDTALAEGVREPSGVSPPTTATEATSTPTPARILVPADQRFERHPSRHQVVRLKGWCSSRCRRWRCPRVFTLREHSNSPTVAGPVMGRVLESAWVQVTPSSER